MAEEKMSFTGKDKEILVKIVKQAQACKVKGSKGDWKEFLDSQDRKFGASLSDPTKRSWELLADFVNTFTSKEDIEMANRLIKWNKCIKIRESQMTKALGKASPKQELVHLTFEHPQFLKFYSFPSYEKGWLTTNLGKSSKASDLETMISVDCEMVICEDGTKEVVKVCAVNQNLETLIDDLVKPSKPVVDYLTAITGITAEDLEGVTCNLQDIQKSLKRLLEHGTILVGHSLYHDMGALRIDHARVIDTIFIFRYRNRPSCYSPSLSKLCKVVLGYDLRVEGKPHVCLDDAIAAMRLTLAKLDLGLNDPIDLGDNNVSEVDLLKLYIHKIPGSISLEDIVNLFPKKYSVEIQAFSHVKNKPSTTFAIFKSTEDANEAFDNLRGVLEKDTFGRPQKSVWFHKGGSKRGANVNIRVRKMNIVVEVPDSQLHDCNNNLIVTKKKSRKISDNISDVDMKTFSFPSRKKGKFDKSMNQEIPMHNDLENKCNDFVRLEEQIRLMKEPE